MEGAISNARRWAEKAKVAGAEINEEALESRITAIEAEGYSKGVEHSLEVAQQHAQRREAASTAGAISDARRYAEKAKVAGAKIDEEALESRITAIEAKY